MNDIVDAIRKSILYKWKQVGSIYLSLDGLKASIFIYHVDCLDNINSRIVRVMRISWVNFKIVYLKKYFYVYRYSCIC